MVEREADLAVFKASLYSIVLSFHEMWKKHYLVLCILHLAKASKPT